jgi:phosphonate transport system ATP-binding protein
MSIAIRELSKRFRNRAALDRVSLDVAPGEMVALIGPSGSGKSTLLRHVAGLVTADSGSGTVSLGQRIVQQGGRLARDVRSIRSSIGFVFQQFNLVNRLSVETNVLVGGLHRLPRWRTLCGLFPYREREHAMAALGRVGMADFAAQRAGTLSGGQQQRVAIARAMHQGATTVLADEPIASLDPSSARRVMDGLSDLNRRDGATVVVSLHQVGYARSYCPRAVALRDGKIVYDGPSEQLTDERLREIYSCDLDRDDDETGVRRPVAAPTAPLLEPIPA